MGFASQIQALGPLCVGVGKYLELGRQVLTNTWQATGKAMEVSGRYLKQESGYVLATSAVGILAHKISNLRMDSTSLPAMGILVAFGSMLATRGDAFRGDGLGVYAGISLATGCMMLDSQVGTSTSWRRWNYNMLAAVFSESGEGGIAIPSRYTDALKRAACAFAVGGGSAALVRALGLPLSVVDATWAGVLGARIGQLVQRRGHFGNPSSDGLRDVKLLALAVVILASRWG